MKKSSPILLIVFTALIHAFFWIGVYFFYNYFLGFGSQNTAYINRFSLYLMPVTISVGYFFVYYLIPNYLLQKKQQLFALYSLYVFIVSFFFIVFSIFFGQVFSAELIMEESYIPLRKSILFIILGVYFVIFIVICISLIIYNYKEGIKNEDLKNKFLETELQLKEQELKFLKMQIHPHFLFNSLNTIYGFALKKKEEAPEMILKLSNLLDYILYQSEKPFVFLTDEIDHLEDYVSLEKMRFHDTLKINFKKNIDSEAIQIAPMLFIPFVENSFKHGAIVDGELQVDICIELKENHLFFSIENSIENSSKSTKGIGLENIQKRLKMLYKDAYSLKTTKTNTHYKTELKIETDVLKHERNVK